MVPVTPINVIDCSTVIINSVAITPKTYTLQDSAQIEQLSGWTLTNANGYCGPITYTLTNGDGTAASLAFNLDSTLNALTIYSTDANDVKVHNLKVTGSLAYGSVTASEIFTVTIDAPCPTMIVDIDLSSVNPANYNLRDPI